MNERTNGHCELLSEPKIHAFLADFLGRNSDSCHAMSEGWNYEMNPMVMFPYIISPAIYPALTRHVSIFSSLPECQLAGELLTIDPDQTRLHLS